MPLKVDQKVWFLDNIGDINLKYGKIYAVHSILQSYNDVEYGTPKYYYVHKYDVQRPVTNEIRQNVYKIFLTEREGLEYIAGTLSVSIAVQEDERKRCLQRIDWLEDEITSARAKIEEIQERLNEI
jgi:hypothetical protein